MPARCCAPAGAGQDKGTQGTGASRRAQPVKPDRKAQKRKADAKRIKAAQLNKSALRLGPKHGRNKQRAPPPWWVRAASRVDGALALGDTWILTSTQLLSSLLPGTQLLQHGALALGAWLCVSGARGDFTCAQRLSDEGSHIVGWRVYSGVLQACFSWMLYAPLHMLLLALLVSNGVFDAEPVLGLGMGSRVSPVLEADLALLATMATWRAFYYGMAEGLL